MGKCELSEALAPLWTLSKQKSFYCVFANRAKGLNLIDSNHKWLFGWSGLSHSCNLCLPFKTGNTLLEL